MWVKLENLFQDTDSAICLPQCQPGSKMASKYTEEVFCLVRRVTGQNSQWGKNVDLLFTKAQHTLLLPGQGVDAMMAYRGLSRPDTTSKCLGMDKSEQEAENVQVSESSTCQNLKATIKIVKTIIFSTFWWYQLICPPCSLQLSKSWSQLLSSMNRSGFTVYVFV